MGLLVGLFLRWTEYAQNMEEAREEVWSIVKEHRERPGPDRTNNTLSTHCDTLTPFENLMDELTILWPHGWKDIVETVTIMRVLARISPIKWVSLAITDTQNIWYIWLPIRYKVIYESNLMFCHWIVIRHACIWRSDILAVLCLTFKQNAYVNDVFIVVCLSSLLGFTVIWDNINDDVLL